MKEKIPISEYLDLVGLLFGSNEEPFVYSDGWEQEGFSPQEAWIWHRYRFLPKEARRWKKVASPQVALICSLFGYTPSRARPWVDKGFTSDFATVPTWEKYGFSPAEAASWKELGCTPREAKRLKEEGYTPFSYRRRVIETLERRGAFEAFRFHLLSRVGIGSSQG